MRIRRLRAEDIPAAIRLSSQSEWNQKKADWHRLLDLAPDACFVGLVDSEIIATSTLVTYDGDMGWIGMVLVDEGHRRQGFGMQIFEHTLGTAIDRGLSTLGLDATDAGRSVYRQVGFVDAAPIERWKGRLNVSAPNDSAGAVAWNPSLSRLHALDRRTCDVDRTALLTHLAGEDEVTTLLVSDSSGGEDLGYAIVRPGRKHVHLGPVVAADVEVLAVLLESAEEILGGVSVIADVIAGDDEKAVLREMGLTQQRHLTRMTYEQSSQPLMGESVVATAGFELG